MDMSVHQNHDAGATGIVPTIAVANMTGGVGKTTTTRIIDFMWSSAGTPLQLVSIDAAGEESSTSLELVASDVIRMTFDVDEKKVVGGNLVRAQSEHWDRLGDFLDQGGYLIDFGANAVHRALKWARESKPKSLLEHAPPLFMVVPITGTPMAADHALQMMKGFADVEGDFMKVHFVVAFNEKDGPVEGSKVRQIEDLLVYIKAKKIPTFTIPHGASMDLTARFSFMDLATSKPREFAKREDIGAMTANTRLRLFTNWLEPVVKGAAAAGLGPKLDEVGKAA